MITLGPNWRILQPMIKGTRRLGFESSLHERWIELIFVFDGGGRFVRVQVDGDSGPPPLWSRSDERMMGRGGISNGWVRRDFIGTAGVCRETAFANMGIRGRPNC